VAKKLSAIALSWASPAEPTEGTTFIRRRRALDPDRFA
jgi:hypothetical protein